MKSFDIQPIISLDPKPKKVKYFLEEKFDTFITAKDVNNLLYRNRNKTDDTHSSLNDFAKTFCKAEKNILKIVSHETTINMVYIQLAESVQLFRSFPNVLLIDITYKINNLNLPLLVFMVSDNMGCGRIIAGCFVSSEMKTDIEQALQLFKEHNTEAFKVFF